MFQRVVHHSRDQMSRQVVGAVEVANGDMVVCHVDAGDGAIVEQEPTVQIVRSGAPWMVEDGTH